MWVVLGAVALRLALTTSWKQPYHCHGIGKRELARTTAQDLAFSAYPQWAMTHAGCPRLDDLRDYVGADAGAQDPWGGRWQLVCANGRLVVHSDGEDAESLTDDDVWSDRD